MVVVSYMPNPSRGDIHLLIEATGHADFKATVESPAVKPTIPTRPEVTTETSVHPQDQDLDISAQDITSAFVSLYLLFRLTFVLKH